MVHVPAAHRTVYRGVSPHLTGPHAGRSLESVPRGARGGVVITADEWRAQKKAYGRTGAKLPSGRTYQIPDPEQRAPQLRVGGRFVAEGAEGPKRRRKGRKPSPSWDQWVAWSVGAEPDDEGRTRGPNGDFMSPEEFQRRLDEVRRKARKRKGQEYQERIEARRTERLERVRGWLERWRDAVKAEGYAASYSTHRNADGTTSALFEVRTDPEQGEFRCEREAGTGAIVNRDEYAVKIREMMRVVSLEVPLPVPRPRSLWARGRLTIGTGFQSDYASLAGLRGPFTLETHPTRMEQGGDQRIGIQRAIMHVQGVPGASVREGTQRGMVENLVVERDACITSFSIMMRWDTRPERRPMPKADSATMRKRRRSEAAKKAAETRRKKRKARK